MDRPAEPWLTPQTSSPRFLMASTVGPACAAPAMASAAAAPVVALMRKLMPMRRAFMPVLYSSYARKACILGVAARESSDCLVIWI